MRKLELKISNTYYYNKMKIYDILKIHYSQKLFLTLCTKKLYTTTEQRYSRLNIGTTQEWGKICQKGSLRKPLTAIAPPSTQAQCYSTTYYFRGAHQESSLHSVSIYVRTYISHFSVRPRFTYIHIIFDRELGVVVLSIPFRCRGHLPK